MKNGWTVNQLEGTATGPSVIVPVPNADRAVQVTAYWSDEDGVGVCVEYMPDTFVPRDTALAIMDSLRDLLSIEPPTLAATPEQIGA